MTRNHLKARAAPRTWNVSRKTETFVTRPNAGSQKIELTLPLGMLMRSLAIADTKKEINYIIKNDSVLVNGKKRHDFNFGVGFQDVLSLPKLKAHYVLSMDSKGRLAAEQIDEKHAGHKLTQSRGVSAIKQGKLQLHLSDGRNIFVDKPVSYGATVIVKIPESTVIKTLPVAEKAHVILMSGKHRGKRGTIESITDDMIAVKTHEGSISTKKAYAFVLGGEQ